MQMSLTSIYKIKKLFTIYVYSGIAMKKGIDSQRLCDNHYQIKL